MFQFDQQTNITVLGGALIALFCFLTLIVPRRFAFAPLVLTLFWLTLGQRVVLFDINFQAIRFILAAVYLRLLLYGEYRGLQFTKVDRMFALWMVTSFVAYSLQIGTFGAVINRLGFLFDAFGAFYAFRVWVRTKTDVWNLISLVVIAMIPVAAVMMLEKQTGRNLFAQLGGVREFTKIRDGIMRCQGPFSHPILAGTMGAIWIPAFIALGWAKRSYVLCVLGLAASLTMVYTSGSSTPILTVLLGVLGIGMWPLRKRMQIVRRGIVGGLIVVQLLMSRPIWFIFATINVLAGSTGWHRSHLIDQAVRHWYQWVLVGYENVLGWGVWYGDITNHYLLEGLRGGLLAMCFFISVIVICFSRVGKITSYDNDGVSVNDRRLMWGLGSMLFAHTVTFTSIAYYDTQSMATFYATVGVILGLYGVLERDQWVEEEHEAPAMESSGWWTPSPTHVSARGMEFRWRQI